MAEGTDLDRLIRWADELSRDDFRLEHVAKWVDGARVELEVLRLDPIHWRILKKARDEVEIFPIDVAAETCLKLADRGLLTPTRTRGYRLSDRGKAVLDA